MIKPLRYAIPLLTLVLLAGGCATERLNLKTDRKLTPAQVNRIKPGTSTKKEVTEAVGLPIDRLTFPDGTEQWFYKDWNLRNLWIEFDPQGNISEMNFDGE